MDWVIISCFFLVFGVLMFIFMREGLSFPAKNLDYDEIDKLRKRCRCGKHEECVRKLKANERGLYVEGHFECGEVQNQIKELRDWWDEQKESE